MQINGQNHIVRDNVSGTSYRNFETRMVAGTPLSTSFAGAISVAHVGGINAICGQGTGNLVHCTWFADNTGVNTNYFDSQWAAGTGFDNWILNFNGTYPTFTNKQFPSTNNGVLCLAWDGTNNANNLTHRSDGIGTTNSCQPGATPVGATKYLYRVLYSSGSVNAANEVTRTRELCIWGADKTSSLAALEAELHARHALTPKVGVCVLIGSSTSHRPGGAAVANKLGINVAFATGKPCTNGGTIFLPQIKGAVSEDAFRELCGIVVHEAAHVYFSTPDEMSCYVRQSHRQTKLHRDCFNAVVDVADETRIEFYMPSARSLLNFTNSRCARRMVSTDSLAKDDKARVALCAAIIGVRVGWSKPFRAAIASAELTNADDRRGLALKCYKILRNAKQRSTVHMRNLDASGMPRRRTRTQVQWEGLYNLADQLFEVLKQAGCPDGGHDNGQSQQDQPFGPAGNGTGAGQVPGATGQDLAQQIAQGGGNAGTGPGEKMAGRTEGENAAATGDPQQGVQGQQQQAQASQPGQQGPSQASQQGGGGAGSGSGDLWSGQPMDGLTFASTRMVLAGVIERLARSDDADGAVGGHRSGPLLSRDIERAVLDGNCFARRNGEGEQVHVSILVDCSGSMNYNRPTQVAAVAEAFRQAVAPVAGSLECWKFGSRCTQVQNFTLGHDTYGGTCTHYAIEQAAKTLSARRGRKVCVVITDGSPDDPAKTVQQVQAMRAADIAVIGIAYRCPDNHIRASMTGAHIVAAQTTTELSLQLMHVAARIAK